MPDPSPVLLMARELGQGGTERQLATIARTLDRSRFTPHVGCFHGEGFRAAELRASGVPILELPVRSLLSGSLISGAARMSRYLRRNGIRLVHAFDVPMNLFAVPMARLFGVPLVLSSQRAHRDLTPGLTRHLLRFTDRMVDALVVNSAAVRRQLIEEDRVPPSLLRLCYNGIDTSVFYPAVTPRPEVLRGASLVIGVICALRPEKDLPTLLKAFAQVRGEREGLKLLVVGSGPVLPQIEKLRDDLHLTEDCIFEPSTADVADWLRAIDIFVLPSLSEALSNSLMEAMACGCCVVASRVGGNPELIADGESGCLFPAGDAGALSTVLHRLIDSDTLRRGLAAAAARRMRAQFSLEAATAKMESVYATLLAELRSSSRDASSRDTGKGSRAC